MRQVDRLIQNKRERLFCTRPFESLMLTADPEVGVVARICCSSWLSPLGKQEAQVVLPKDINPTVISRVWTDPHFSAMRKAMLEGDTKYCSKNCPSLANAWHGPSLYKDLDFLSGSGIRPPSHVDLAIDHLCNLYCGSCRKKPITTSNPFSVPILISTLKTGTPSISLNGAGEFFVHRELLNFFRTFDKKEYPLLKSIKILTNGNALTPEKWGALSQDTLGIIDQVNLSVDAATAEVYKQIRRGGVFTRVMSAIEFLAYEKKTAGVIKAIECGMVVQRANYHQIIDFANLCFEKGATIVKYIQVADWGSNTEYPSIKLSEEMILDSREKVKEVRRIYEPLGYTIFSNL